MELVNSLPPGLREIVVAGGLALVGFVLGRILAGPVLGLLSLLGLKTWRRLPWLERPDLAISASKSEPLSNAESPQAASEATANTTPTDGTPGANPLTLRPPTRSPSEDDSPTEGARLEQLVRGLVTITGVLLGLWFSADLLRWQGTRLALERLGGFAMGGLGIAAVSIWLGELIVKPAIVAAFPQSLAHRIDALLDSRGDELRLSQVLQGALASLAYLAIALLGAQFAIEAGFWTGGQATVGTVWGLVTKVFTLALVWALCGTMFVLLSPGSDSANSGPSTAWGFGRVAILGMALLLSVGIVTGQLGWILGPAILAAAAAVAWPLRGMFEDRAAGWYLRANSLTEVWYKGERLSVLEVRPCVTRVTDRDGGEWTLPNRLLVEAFQKGVPEARRRSSSTTHESTANDPVGGAPVRYTGIATPVSSDDESSPAATSERVVPSSPLTPGRPAIEWDDAADGYPLIPTSSSET